MSLNTALTRLIDYWLRSEEKCRLLAASPEIGEARDDLGSGVRCFTHGNYVIFYKVIVGGIQLIRVLSGRPEHRRPFRP